MKKISLSHLRKEYLSPKPLERNRLDSNPLDEFAAWLQQALDAEEIEPNAMVLATADAQGKPSSRTVLLKELNSEGLIFFTHYASRKSQELLANPYASVTFYWPKLLRQVTIEGSVEKISREQSEKYFQQRPRKTQIACWASEQDQVITSRKILEEKCAHYENLYKDRDVPLPPNWGGFLLKPTQFVFWQGQPNRLHDRFRYTLHNNSWKIEQLAP